ncbi:MAG: hypothetical protein JWR00_292 [Rubritepida sp.]|nr:hypothetical protein [Rubritepida sp.]
MRPLAGGAEASTTRMSAWRDAAADEPIADDARGVAMGTREIEEVVDLAPYVVLGEATAHRASLTEDNGQAISLKLVETKLDDAWHGQGITEKVVQLVCDQTSLSPPGFEEP